MTLYLWIAAALAAVVFATGFFGRKYARHFMLSRGIRVDRFKLKRKHGEIELEVFGSREVVRAVKAYASEHHVPVDEARRQAGKYLHEILPKFNLLAYYRVGAPVARALLYLLYWVVVERSVLKDFNNRLPRESTVIYVINHRSNADYVLVAHMLFKFISLSYAVGEWARVWPLNHLFKWFGAYFIRRRFREPLYHAVLSTFVQTITRRGVTQGIFIEGGLTRDGAFRKPKIGMLDYIVSSKRDPEFTQPLYLVPTAINYDRVLEDRNLTDELLGKEDRRTRGEKLRTTADYLFKNVFRSMVRRFRRYGYAVVSFGLPLSIDEFMATHPQLRAETYEERKPAMNLLADEIMERISDALPVTPVTLIASIVRDLGPNLIAESTLVGEIANRHEQWKNRIWLLREESPQRIWEAGREVLMLRRLMEQENGGWRWKPDELLLLDYYANSLIPYSEVKRRGWPESPKLAEA